MGMRMEPLYEVTVAGSESSTATASVLMEAWQDNAPEGTAQALELAIGAQAVIMELPRVVVRRLR